MKEVVKWVPAGQSPVHCPYCGSIDIRLTEVHTLWSCLTCGRDFLVRHYHPKPQKRPRSMSPEELWALQRKANSEDKAE